jgi:hypothetical protein
MAAYLLGVNRVCGNSTSSLLPVALCPRDQASQVGRLVVTLPADGRASSHTNVPIQGSKYVPQPSNWD